MRRAEEDNGYQAFEVSVVIDASGQATVSAADFEDHELAERGASAQTARVYLPPHPLD